jgi:hypothetical protein
MKTEPKADVYTRVTDKIIADLEQGVRPGRNRGTQETQPRGSPSPCVTTASPIGRQHHPPVGRNPSNTATSPTAG